jgi:methyl-galactoside transport system substrate-binding protein
MVAGVAILTSCSGASKVANKDKPLIFFNRQPSDPTTGVIDTKTMNFSDKTFYVGFDAKAGGDVQGKMITDYLKTKTIAELDKDKDGKLGYVLAIGDEGHNDSKARTLGIRKALGTVKNNSTSAGDAVEGEVEVKDGKLKVVELDSKAMTGSDGSTWNADAAKEAFSAWAGKYGGAINMVVSNNDGMAEGMKSSSSWVAGTPLFGYDANADALQDIKNGAMTGTVSQNVDAQAAGTLQMVRNLFDGVAPADAVKKGFSEADQYGNKITPTMTYIAADKSILAANSAVTATNIDEYYSPAGAVRDAGIKDITAKAKKIKLWISLYNGSDNFLSASYMPALKAYAALMNIDLHEVDGDGQSENSVSDNFTNLSNYDAYAVNMVKTNSGESYTGKLA